MGDARVVVLARMIWAVIAFASERKVMVIVYTGGKERRDKFGEEKKSE